MKGKFNTIKKSRKKSKGIDEKIEYLNKECQKTDLNEITMSTSGIYQGTTSNPNSGYAEITAKNFNGKGFAMSGDSNLGQGSFGGASIRASDGAALSPDGKTTQTKAGISPMFKLAIPGERPTPDSRMTGPIMWYWTGSSWGSLEYNASGVHGNQPYPFGGNNAGWGYWGSNFMGFPMLRNDGEAFASLFNEIDDFDPKDSNPETIVLTQNRLDDPSFTPVNIGEMSPQAFDTILDKAKRDKVDRIARTGRYPNASEQKFLQDYLNNISDPARQESERMRIFRLNGVFFPLASAGEPVSDVDIPGLGAKPGDMLAGFFGDSPKEKAEKELKKVVDKGRSGMFYNNALNFAHQAASSQNYGTASNPRDEAAFIKRYGVTPQQFLKYAASGDVKHLKDIQVDNILNQSYQPEGNVLSEDVKLGHFEPEVLNVDINDIRKGIVPEFPKDPPPEMIGGYSAKSRLVRKDPELPPFIKVTRKDLARNHKLTDKEISDFMNDVKMINDYINKNPAELIYAMTRYPKDDPRLAQLNWQMDQKMKASEEYMETHFPENQRLFNKLQAKIKQNIELTDPKNFTGHAEAPKFTDDNLEMNEQKKKTVLKYFKKPVKKNKRNRIQRHINMKEVKKKNMEEVNARNLEEKRIENKNQILKSAYEKQKSDWKEDLKEFTGWQAVAGEGPTNATSQTFGYFDGGFPVPNSETGQQVTTTASGLGGVEVQPSVVNLDLGFGETMPVNPPTYDQLALAGYAKPILLKRDENVDVNSRLDSSQEFAQKVGADTMMNARVDDEEKSNFVFGVDDPTKPGVMKDDAEIAMNKKLYAFQEKSTKVTQQNTSISKEHDRKIVRPYVEGQLKSLKLKTVGGLTPVEQLYKFRSVSNESGTKTVSLRRGKDKVIIRTETYNPTTGYTSSKEESFDDPKLIKLPVMSKELQMWASQSIDPTGAITRPAGAALAKIGRVESAFNLVNYYIDNHVKTYAGYDPARANIRHNVTDIFDNKTKDILRKGMDELKPEIDAAIEEYEKNKLRIGEKQARNILDGKVSATKDNKGGGLVNSYFIHGGAGKSSRDIFNSLGNNLGFNLDTYMNTGNYQFDSTYLFTSTLDMGIRGKLAFLSGASQKYVSGQLYGETGMAVQNPMQFQVDIESGRQYSDIKNRRGRTITPADPEPTKAVETKPTITPADPKPAKAVETTPTKEPSKAIKKIKSMAKTKRQSLNLDEPIVRRKKKSLQDK